MRIYLAARYSRAEQLRVYRDQLTAMGHTITSRWIDGDHTIVDGLSEEATAAERLRFAEEDLSDLFRARWLICFTEEPRKTNTRGGRHVEFGVALALAYRIVAIGWRENVFYSLPQVEFHSTWEQFITSEEHRNGNDN